MIARSLRQSATRLRSLDISLITKPRSCTHLSLTHLPWTAHVQGAVNTLKWRAENEGALGDRRIAGTELAAVLVQESKIFQSLGVDFVKSMIRCSKTVILAPGSSW